LWTWCSAKSNLRAKPRASPDRCQIRCFSIG
jgi:hypothetical protein